jgi:ABC-type Fe3+/spermidine/putrescine transport system ATPase subunit
VNVIEATGLGKRYGRTWALRDCSLAIPGGHVAALVGPNGAGKTTLLNLVVGLAAPSAGSLTVLGRLPAGSPAALDGIAFVAQDTPLYKNLSAADMLLPALHGPAARVPTFRLRSSRRTSSYCATSPGTGTRSGRDTSRPAGLGLPVDRGRLAGRAVGAAHSRHSLAGPPPVSRTHG